MLRTILFLVIITGWALISGFIVSEFNFHRGIGYLLEDVFGTLSDERDAAEAGLIALFVAWGSYTTFLAIPQWRRAMAESLSDWPLRQFPGSSFMLRTLVISVVAPLAYLVVENAINITGVSNFCAVVLVAVYIGALLYDYRGIVFGEPPGRNGELLGSSGWVLPTAITEDILASPKLRYELAHDLRNRALQTRRFSLFALAGIGGLLVVAVCVILFAGFIANLGVGATGPERIEELRAIEEAGLAQVREDLADHEKAQDTAFLRFVNDSRANAGQALIDSVKQIEDPQGQLRNAFEETDFFLSWKIREDYLQREMLSHREALRAIDSGRIDYLKKTIESDFGAKEEAENLNLLIASGITRFGILFIMLFIVQILVNLYRYTMRLSAYYLSQADALLLAEDGVDSLIKIMPVISPQDVDFGKPPATPIQNLEKMIELAAKLR